LPTYQYIAKSPSGEEVSGLMQADNETAVIRTLDDRELFPVSVEPHADAAASRGRRVKMRDVAVAYGQLADLLRAGVPMLRALETLVRAIQTPALSRILAEVREDVAAGETLADAMGKHPETFTSLHAAMIRAGERGGFLEDVLTNLGEYLERQDEMRSKIRGAMVYPVVLVTIGVIAMVCILVILVPRFKPFFKNADLPAPTLVLFALSDLLLDHLVLLIVGLVLVVVGLRMAIRSDSGRRVWDRYRIAIPWVGNVIRTMCITRFCRILGTMLRNGVPILQALRISKDAAGNMALADCIETASERVEAGEQLVEPLRTSRFFPVEIIEMIAVAEESNQLDKVLVQIADTVERRANRQVDAVVRLIEPLILVVIATMIGFVAVGLLYPIFTMSQTLR